MRAAYVIAMNTTRDEEEAAKKAKADQLEADMEKPLDPEVKRQLIKGWADRHDWQPVNSMKAAPNFSELRG